MTWFPNKTCWRWRSWILISKGGMLNVCLLPGLCNISTNLTVWKLRSYELCRLLGVRPHITSANYGWGTSQRISTTYPSSSGPSAKHWCKFWYPRFSSIYPAQGICRKQADFVRVSNRSVDACIHCVHLFCWSLLCPARSARGLLNTLSCFAVPSVSRWTLSPGGSKFLHAPLCKSASCRPC